MEVIEQGHALSGSLVRVSRMTVYGFELNYDLKMKKTTFKVRYLFKGKSTIKASDVMTTDFHILSQMAEAKISLIKVGRPLEGEIKPNLVVHDTVSNRLSLELIRLGAGENIRNQNFEIKKPEGFDRNGYRDYLKSTYVQQGQTDREYIRNIWDKETSHGYSEDELLFKMLVALPRTNGDATANFVEGLEGEITKIHFTGKDLALTIQY